jgi:hypothetical protein
MSLDDFAARLRADIALRGRVSLEK